MRTLFRTASALVLVALSLCACGHQGPSGPSTVPPEFTGVKVGKPYVIAGKTYHPRFDNTYDETGVASWYGPGFHGKKTANGETFNQWDYTAAHTTLPMPSIVRVTNLENGRSMNVRINDRGPFHSNRIIDLSKASAEKLGITGLAKVRVRFLHDDTLAYVRSRGLKMPDIQYARGEEKKISPYDDSIAEEVPLQIASYNRPVVDSAPTTSVAIKPLAPLLKPLVKEAYAEEAPYAPLRTEAQNVSAAAIELPQDSSAKGSNWAVQVGSYSLRENAEKMMQKLIAVGQPMMTPLLVDGRTFYRVMLRPSSWEDSPDRLLGSVRAFGVADARIITP